MADDTITVDALMIEYDFPGPPYHPADVMLAQFRRDRRMEEIRELDIEAWAQKQLLPESKHGFSSDLRLEKTESGGVRWVKDA